MPYSNSNCDRWFLGTDSEHIDAQHIILQRLCEVVKNHSCVRMEQMERNKRKNQQQDSNFGSSSSSVFVHENDHDDDDSNNHNNNNVKERMNRAWNLQNQSSSSDDLSPAATGKLDFRATNYEEEDDDDEDGNGVVAYRDEFTGKKYTNDQLLDIEFEEESRRKQQEQEKALRKPNLQQSTIPGFMSSRNVISQQQHHQEKANNNKNYQQQQQQLNNLLFDASSFDQNGMKTLVIPAPELQQEMVRMERNAARDDFQARNILEMSQASNSAATPNLAMSRMQTPNHRKTPNHHSTQ